MCSICFELRASGKAKWQFFSKANWAAAAAAASTSTLAKEEEEEDAAALSAYLQARPGQASKIDRSVDVYILIRSENSCRVL